MSNSPLDTETINTLRDLRSKGYSLPEISKELQIPQTTVFRYIKNVEILPEYLSVWAIKRGGSIKRKLEKEKEAFENGKKLINELSKKERLLFLSALYWAEGNKTDFILTNTDPDLIQVFVNGLREVFGVSDNRLRISIRIYEDMNINTCLDFWSSIVNIPKEYFLTTAILVGKKNGKLEYGMCRVRVLKGGDLLKQIMGINKAFVYAFSSKNDTI